MNRPLNDRLPEPLMPEPMLHDDPVRRDEQVQRLMAAASPMLARYRTGEMTWWTVLAARFRPSLAIAAAAAAVLAIVVHLAIPVRPNGSTENIPLATLISDGEPSSLLSVVSGESDPTLALVLLEGETP